MVNGVGWVGAVVGVGVGRFGPGLPLEVGGRERVEVVLCGVRKKRPCVFGVEKIK